MVFRYLVKTCFIKFFLFNAIACFFVRQCFKEKWKHNFDYWNAVGLLRKRESENTALVRRGKVIPGTP